MENFPKAAPEHASEDESVEDPMEGMHIESRGGYDGQRGDGADKWIKAKESELNTDARGNPIIEGGGMSDEQRKEWQRQGAPSPFVNTEGVPSAKPLTGEALPDEDREKPAEQPGRVV